ncbi:L-arabinose 1-dehydrogenase (NAD(P)(+)) [uncultured archaeon]|nr:L-arabinose 1-dehydrogenase (NAD(P)(+)) [uncultured archaeon]
MARYDKLYLHFLQILERMLEDMSILVTGGAGFIGSHLVDRLLETSQITVLDNFSSGKRDHIAHVLGHPRFALVEADLFDAGTLEDTMAGKDFVFHLAANPDVKLGAEDTKIHLQQNILATYSLLEAMRKTGVGKIAFTSTSTVYGEASLVPTPENYGPLKPISLYGASKLACEALISSYCHTFDMQSWIFRFANIVGKRGTHGVLVDFINKLKKNSTELEILGSGQQRKSYLEVGDCVTAMVYAVEHSSDQTNIFNIGSNDAVDVTKIANIGAESMGRGAVKYTDTGVLHGRGWKGDVKIMQLSIDALSSLGWRPVHDSGESIKVAVDALLEDMSECNEA